MQEQILMFFHEHATPFLDRTAELVTMLGEEYFFIIVISFVYWVISRKTGFKLATIFVFSSVANAVVKIAVRSPRPFEKLPALAGKRVETATGYSFPSGHTQGATSFFTSVAFILRRWWVTLISVIVVLAVAASRVYLEVHWPADVVGGIVLGVLIAVWLNGVIERLWETPKKLARFFYALTTALLVIAIALAVVDATVLKGSWKIADFFKIAGMSLGLVEGFFLQERFIRFDPAYGGVVRKAVRYIVGLAVAIGLRLVLKLLFPETVVFDYLRYAIVGLWVTYLWPLAGTALRIFAKESAGDTAPGNGKEAGASGDTPGIGKGAR